MSASRKEKKKRTVFLLWFHTVVSFPSFFFVCEKKRGNRKHIVFRVLDCIINSCMLECVYVCV